MNESSSIRGWYHGIVNSGYKMHLYNVRVAFINLIEFYWIAGTFMRLQKSDIMEIKRI